VEEVVQEAVERHRYLLRGKPTQVEVTVRATPILTVERSLLYVVVSNLIRNAFSYTDQGAIQILLLANQVVIRDSGQGIRADELGKVFERHYRGSSGRGEGIGLSLVKRICARFDWEVTITSQVGEGTLAILRFAPEHLAHQAQSALAVSVPPT
jgi:signal transduction histidine kinase